MDGMVWDGYGTGFLYATARWKDCCVYSLAFCLCMCMYHVTMTDRDCDRDCNSS
jgi:hypothetical protein